MKFILENLYLIVIALASGGLLLWPLLKRGSGSASVSPLQATQLINHRNAIVIDVRDEQAFAAGSLTGARNIPSAGLEQRVAELVRFKARPVILVCESGQQSMKAVSILKAQGFEETHTLAGGLSAWKQAGLPLVQAARETGRSAQKESNRSRARSEGRAEARTSDKARAAAKAANQAARRPTSGAATRPDAPALNGRAVLDDAAVNAEGTRVDPANEASTPVRVKEAS